MVLVKKHHLPYLVKKTFRSNVCLLAISLPVTTLYAQNNDALSADTESSDTVSSQPLLIVDSQNSDLPNGDTLSMDAITVTATGPVQSKSVTNDKIAVRQAENVKDILREVPGVNVGGSLGINQRVNIRGLDDSNLNVTIDGARQEGFIFHHSGDIGIDTDILKRVDVAVGNNSVTNGSGVLGGAVSYETVDAADLLKPGENIGARVKAGYGSNNNEASSAVTAYGRAYEQLDFLGYFNYRNLDLAEDGDYRDIHGSGKIQNYLFKSEWTPSVEHMVGISYEEYINEGYYGIRPDFTITGPDGFNRRVYSEFDRETATLNYGFTPISDSPDFSLVDFRVSGYLNEVSFDRPRNVEQTHGVIETNGFDVKNTSVMNFGPVAQRFNYGYEFYDKESRNTSLARPGIVNGEDADSNSFYIEDQITLWERLHLTPGLRYDVYDVNLSTFEDTYHEVSGSYFGQLDITDELSAFAGYTELFKGPELSEIYIGAGDGFVAPDEKLRAEEGSNLEIGGTYNRQGVFTDGNDAFSTSYTYFSTDFQNTIVMADVDCQIGSEVAVCEQFQNTGGADVHGFEITAGYQIHDWSVNFSYAKARSNVNATGLPIGSDANGNTETGNTINVNLEGLIDRYNLIAGWNSRIVDTLHVKDGNDKPSYDVHDIYFSWTPGKKFFSGSLDGLQVDLGVYNLLNESYYDHASRSFGVEDGVDFSDYEMGTNVKLTLRYEF